MRNRKIVITGAGRGLGRALSIVAARRGAFPILLGRSEDALQSVADVISNDSSPRPNIVVCDLSDTASVTQAATEIAISHPDIDILVNNGAHWTGGAFEHQTNDQILAVVNSVVTGTLVLTRQLLPLLKARAHADIHTVVSMSGLSYTRFAGASLPFRAAKSAQDGFAKGLVEELQGSSVRVTSIYPGMIEDVSPEAPEWNRERGINESLTNRDVVDAILFALSAPANVSFRQIVIERTRSDFLLSG
ncbi:SDR family oxidoreductase [Stappia sp. ES.058]|uniref:SDR family oxidoreductase n=1 Tax=Stappia sp. ES.058 TaxID=1881061 RepID=UPI00087DF1F4|nr:SDR family oxidoreductase [Stappia sp. ES.058]SDU42894.1 Short-chain dehydrogenase [Stappia sp. ES.058]